jgi:hypothetical protein
MVKALLLSYPMCFSSHGCFVGHSTSRSLFFSISPSVAPGKVPNDTRLTDSKHRCLDILYCRGGAQGIDESIFPRRMEIDWVHYYQWR